MQKQKVRFQKTVLEGYAKHIHRLDFTKLSQMTIYKILARFKYIEKFTIGFFLFFG